MYILKIETGFVLPNGEIDSIEVTLNEYDDVFKVAEPFLDAGYSIRIVPIE
jgi:hypothetical protein